MRIILDADTGDCPGAVCKILTAGRGRERSILVQADWDAPSVAAAFGWRLVKVQKAAGGKVRDNASGRGRGQCQHRGTDGTIRCPDCGVEPGDFIGAAVSWIAAHDGKTATDPGYFS